MVLGGSFDSVVAFELGQPVKLDLLGRTLITKIAEAHRLLAGLRHEPRSLSNRLRLLAPGTLDVAV